MTQLSAETDAPASPWAWALFVASSAFCLVAAGLLGFMPG